MAENKGCWRPQRATGLAGVRVLPALPMRWLGRLLVCGLLALLPWLQAPAQAARLALVVGNDGYRQVAPLSNAVRDAELMAQTLQAAGFSVALQRNLDRQALFAAVDQLQGRIRKGDEVAFFFAGHGVQLGNDQVLLPVDIQADDERKLLREGVPLLYVQEALKAAQFSMLVVDACRDNPFPKTGTRSLGDSRGLRPPEPAEGQVVILSAGRGEKALDSVPGEAGVRNGLFTWEFARAVRTPGVDVLGALRRVRDQVQDRAASVSHRQRPSLVDDLRGQFYLFGAAAAAQPAAQPATSQVAVVVPEPQPRPVPQPVGPKPGDVIKDCAVCPELVVIPGGTFVMGSPVTEANRLSDEGPQRDVRIASVAVGRYEVTLEEWDACVTDAGCIHRPNDRGWGRGRRPVMNVSWEDAQEYVKWLSRKTGKGYRLLSEAEWEYAARGGTQTSYSWGEEVGSGQANCKGCGSQWDGKQTAPVGSFKPNAFGLYDMHGNVSEYVQDVLHYSFVGAPSDGRAWIEGGENPWRVIRGGSWYDVPSILRSAVRNRSNPNSRGSFGIGVRIARTLSL